MKKIAKYPLWLGNAADCADVQQILANEIRCIVQLAVEEPIPALPRELCFLRFPIHDGADNDAATLRLAVDTIAELLHSSLPTLICCSAGMSRSPALTACAIALVASRPPGEVLKEIGNDMSTDVSPRLWQDCLRVSSRGGDKPAKLE